MVNWIQKIIPQVKATKSAMDERLRLSLEQLLEADSHFRPGRRNMAGEVFASIYEFKYAAPFMKILAQYVVDQTPADQALRILELTPEKDLVPEVKTRLRP